MDSVLLLRRRRRRIRRRENGWGEEVKYGVVVVIPKKIEWVGIRHLGC
jgi:hypothetical protein